MSAYQETPFGIDKTRREDIYSNKGGGRFEKSIVGDIVCAFAYGVR